MSSDTTTVKKSAPSTGPSTITADDVAAYLKAHPGFFVDRDRLLAGLTIPHPSGKAISLLEHQVQILRERSIESRHTLNTLLENARYNDQLFHVTRNLILTLLQESDIASVISVTEANLSTQPGIDACALVLMNPDADERPARAAAAQEIQQHFPSLSRKSGVVCQMVDKDVARSIFPEHGGHIRSVALCPVAANNRLLAVLALGNHSREYFNKELDTLFLEFISDVLGSIIEKVSS